MRTSAALIALSTILSDNTVVAAPASKSGTVAAMSSSDTVARKYDVAGMKLGMTPAAIRAALIKGGFTPNAQDPDQDDWEARISQEVAKRRTVKVTSGKVPLFTMARGKRGEHIEVGYYAGPQGPLAGSITFSMRADQITVEDFRKAVLAKYGEPTIRVFGKDMLYCSVGESDCHPWQSLEKAYLQAGDAGDPLKLTLAYGRQFGENARSQFSAEVERRAPKDAPVSF